MTDPALPPAPGAVVALPVFPRGSLVCLQCNHIGLAKTNNGLLAIAGELFLWFLCLLPGLIYSLTKSRKDECRSCGGNALVPGASPAGVQILAKFGLTPADLNGQQRHATIK